MLRLSFVIVCLSLLTIVGCTTETETKPAASSSNSGTGIIGKTTQDVGEFDPNKANQVVSDQKIRASDPITAPLSAYGPMVESLAKTQVTHAIGLFQASEGRYPKDHDEFMERIIKENNIKLPVLPFKGRYVYDVEKHELMVVRDIENAEKAKQ
ncbi:MAG: hypothetical protein JSS02_20295 [Planctomycetes bacterium]|nr:hypothetical protein [Planctomycetota bacterium]